MGKNQKGGAAGSAAARERAIADGLTALDAALAQLWESVTAGDVLDAEVRTSELLALPGLADGSDESHARIAAVLIARGADVLPPPEQAAFLRLLMALGTKAVKREASEHLADLAGDDVYPPEWVTGIGRAVPGQAYRARDTFGEQELIAVTFSCGDAEHAVTVALDLAELPVVVMAGLSKEPGDFLKGIQDDPVFGADIAPVALAEARERIEGALARYESDPEHQLDPASAFALPLIRSRLRRLPAPVAGTAAGYTAADRETAVTEFLASPLAAEAGDPEVARFWARVLTGYSSRLPGEPPAAVGRHRLAAALLVHVPRTFGLSPEQRDGMRPAVTAWTRWAAARQGIDQEAAAALVTHLDGYLSDFPEVYDDAESVALRGYVRDLASPDVDLGRLADLRARRELAAPAPAGRAAGTEDVDASGPAGRAVLTEHEFACAPEGADGEKFLATARRVVEELWHDDPAETWQAGKALLAKGLGPHDVIHRLVDTRSK